MVITRCPECHARFRVTDGQLKLARGQVRCGACLSVFDARAQALPEMEEHQPQATSHLESDQPVAAAAPTSPEAASPETPVTPPVEPSTKTVETVEPVAQPRSEDRAASEPPLTVDTAPLTASDTGTTNASPLPFRAEPIALDSQDADDSAVATTGWLLLSLLAVLALAAQLLWFERARLAEYTELRSVYALMCEQVDCSLTDSALPLIDNQGLHLQPHPKYSDALTATILLENRAAFSQPWPGLQLRFTDLKGRLVAQRTFQPEEYLDSASMDPMRMPSGQPVQIELELASPGRRGVSYELKLTPAILASAK